MPDTIDWGRLREIIEANETFVITSHVRPDADAIGSELAMASLLEALGKSVKVINPGATPSHLLFLDPDHRAKSINASPELKASIRECDLHLILDTSAWGQLGDVGKLMQKIETKRAVVDHHASSDDLKATDFKDIKSPATGCLIFEFMRFCGHQPTPLAATQLYAAIATDTGWFRFPATSAETMKTVAALMEAGADPAQLYSQLHEQASLERLKLSGIVLQRATLACDGKLAFTFVTQEDFAKTKAHPADTENLVNECMRIKGTVAAFILVEQPNRKCKVSLRSRESFDVTKIAEPLGGGGHKQASGAMLDGPVEKAIETLQSRFAEQLA